MESLTTSKLTSATSSAQSRAMSGVKRQSILKDRKTVYFIIACVLFGLIGFGAGKLQDYLWSVNTWFTIQQILCGLLGLFHLFLINSGFLSFNIKERPDGVLWYTLALTLFITVVWMLGQYLGLESGEFSWIPASLSFIIPLIAYQSWLQWESIEEPKFLSWKYDPKSMKPDFPSGEKEVFVLRLRKRPQDDQVELLWPAPKAMKLGEYFRRLIDEIQGEGIEYENPQTGLPYEWIFLLKKGWWRKAVVVSHDYSFDLLKIGRNHKIIVKRVNY